MDDVGIEIYYAFGTNVIYNSKFFDSFATIIHQTMQAINLGQVKNEAKRFL